MLTSGQFDLNTYLANQARVKNRQEYDALLEIGALVNQSGQYICIIKTFPTDTLTFSAWEVKQDTLSIEPKSYLISMGFYSNQSEGASFSLLDKGNNLYLSPVRNNFAKGVAGYGKVGRYTIGFGRAYQMSPTVIDNPGQIQINMTNLSSSSATMQLSLMFAVPVTEKLNQSEEVKGRI